MKSNYTLTSKSLCSFIIGCIITLSISACGGDDSSSGGGTTPTTVTLSLTSNSISEGAEVDASSTTVLTLTYSKIIKISSTANITLNGVTISAAINPNNVMAINIPLSLEAGKSYTVKVPSGSIVYASDATVTAADFTLNFTTKAAEEPVKPTISSTPVVATTESAIKLYKYMVAQYGKKVISSVMADVNWNNKCAEKVYTLTGKYPAMNCYDFIHIYVPENNWINYNDTQVVEDWYKAGGIVQLMWHFNVPLSEATEVKSDGSGVTCTPSLTTFKASNALVSGTWENKWFYEQMDKVIAVVLKLQNAGIAATWRPFHEGAGNATAKNQASWTKAWFWWGYDGAETYKKLWIAMFDYFKQKGVNNLIWIWTTQNYNGDNTTFNNDDDWYPGDKSVDMVARDLYGYNADQNQQEFTEIQTRFPNKMVVLGECGKGDNGEQGKISDCWTKGAKWGHFMVWYQGGEGSTNTMCSDAWWKDAMKNTNVITRDQIEY